MEYLVEPIVSAVFSGLLNRDTRRNFRHGKLGAFSNAFYWVMLIALGFACISYVFQVSNNMTLIASGVGIVSLIGVVVMEFALSLRELDTPSAKVPSPYMIRLERYAPTVLAGAWVFAIGLRLFETHWLIALMWAVATVLIFLFFTRIVTRLGKAS